MNFLRRIYRDPETQSTSTGGGDPAKSSSTTSDPATGDGSGTTLIFGKFVDMNAASEGYAESQRTIGRLTNELNELKGQQQQQQTTTTDVAESQQSQQQQHGLSIPKTADQTSEPMTVQQILQDVGLEGEALAKQFTDHGQLTVEQYEKFNGKGWSRAAVDEYLRGQQARVQLYEYEQKEIRSQGISMLGSEDKLNTLLEFAKGLDAARQESINQRLGDPNQFRGALMELAQEYNQQGGFEKSKPFVVGTGPAAGHMATNPFTSRAELRSAQMKARAENGGQPRDEYKDASFKARFDATPDVAALR